MQHSATTFVSTGFKTKPQRTDYYLFLGERFFFYGSELKALDTICLGCGVFSLVIRNMHDYTGNLCTPSTG